MSEFMDFFLKVAISVVLLKHSLSKDLLQSFFDDFKKSSFSSCSFISQEFFSK